MSRYPEIRAGQRITGAMLTGIQFEEVVKQAATVRNNDANVALDPDLQFTLEANATYHVEWFIQYVTVDASDFKTDWQTPSGASGLKRCMGGGVTDNADSANVDFTLFKAGVFGFATLVRYGDRAGGGQAWCYETGTITTSAGGTLGIRWAQNATSANDVEVSAFSYGRIKRIA